jgi:hypothetical protein
VNLRIFFAELKRRNVYKVTIADAIVAWLLIQAATQVFPFFEIPNWAVRLVVLAILGGFPIAGRMIASKSLLENMPTGTNDQIEGSCD